MPWKMVTRHGKNMSLTEAVDSILNQRESKAKKSAKEERESEKKLKRSVKNPLGSTYEGRNGKIK